MIDRRVEELTPAVHRHVPTIDGKPLLRGEFVALLCVDQGFRTAFTDALLAVPFAAFRWETPPVGRDTEHEAFEFVVVDTPYFDHRTTDERPYADQFDADDGPVVVFDNLGGDARLVVPTPTPEAATTHGHLAAFLRGAPEEQIDALWRRTGEEAADLADDRLVWVNTHGGGVAWLHVRLDNRPKYYSHDPYRRSPS